jgi:hypothetical protein
MTQQQACGFYDCALPCGVAHHIVAAPQAAHLEAELGVLLGNYRVMVGRVGQNRITGLDRRKSQHQAGDHDTAHRWRHFSNGKFPPASLCVSVGSDQPSRLFPCAA